MLAPRADRRTRWATCIAATLATLLSSPVAAEQQVGPFEVSGSANVNTKGISLVPALTLGRPAAIFDVVVRKGRGSFEPQFRFALDGKPWSFLLWGRYRAVRGDRFQLTVGGHPAFSFRTTSAVVGGTSRDLIETRRYVAGEITPVFSMTRKVGLGGYYLYSHGLDVGAPPHTHLVAARSVSYTHLTLPTSDLV